MRGREKIRGSGGVGVLVLALLGALLLGLLATPALAKRKRQTLPAVTTVAAVPLAPGSPAATTTKCPSRTHLSGGGWAILNGYSANSTDAPGDDTGTRITHLQSQPSSLTAWTAGAAALASPAVGANFITYARCESNAYGKTLFGVSGSTTVPIGQETTSVLHCPNGTHVLTGGFSFGPAGDLTGNLSSKRAMVLESRRIAVDSWEIDLVNPTGAPAEASISLNVLCEINKKGSTVTEASSVVPIFDNSRTTAAATCTGKTHSVAGGFLISPTVGPAIGIDQMIPVGNKAWQVALFEYPTFVLPAGSSVTAYSYCKKDALPKKR